MIGRSLRAVVDLDALPPITVTVDCDVVNADGGTRCASITGAYIALVIAFENYQSTSPQLPSIQPLRPSVFAWSTIKFSLIFAT